MFRALVLRRSKPKHLAYLIRFDEGPTLETSAFQSLNGGQLTLSTQLIMKSNYLEIISTDAAPQFF